MVHLKQLNQKKKTGFSLIELIVATVILSVGIIVVYQGFLISLRGFNYCIDYLSTQQWMDEKIWEVKDQLIHYRTLLTEDDTGIFIRRNKNFRWDLSYHLIEGIEGKSLYEINLKVFWDEGAQKVSTQRSTYVFFISE
jgi:prepilin-type N-terminal cleavage/methylation domain-containing protein